ncbi:hypothetical protein C8R44DRAFT_75777 [Mycena epipterygia]|nr:hypothetical protein C8R44DRAFT_75777 [Mycena epipterygia]
MSSSMSPQAGATPQGRQKLTDFEWNALYNELYFAFWPPGGRPVKEPLSLEEPPALLRIIETMTANDGWLTSSSQTSDFDAMDVDGPDDDGEGEGDGDGDVDEDPATIRYIRPTDHPALKILGLGDDVNRRCESATFVIRHEYTVFMQHAISCANSRDRRHRDHFFLTGQPGVGKCFGCYYFLFRLLALGQSVFLLPNRTAIYYFSNDGIQKTEKNPEEWPVTDAAISASWVLIDVEKGDFNPPEIFKRARCVIWTSSSQQQRRVNFIKSFGAELWYMKPWSSKEIAGLTDQLGDPRATILQNLKMGGPVARSLFGLQTIPTDETLKIFIQEALKGDLFAFGKDRATQPVHCVFLVQPLVVRDERGLSHLQRTDYCAKFLSPHIAETTFELAQDQLERLQGQLAMALDINATRSVAGRIVEGLMHRALIQNDIKLPAVFGDATVATTLELSGKAGSFVCATPTGPGPIPRPLYLRPQSSTFAAVDAILVTDDITGLIRTSLSKSHHPKDYAMMLRIMSRLRGGARVQLVNEATRTLEALQALDDKTLGQKLGIKSSKIAHTRLSRFRVVGYIFDTNQGFTQVLPPSRV